MFKATQVCRSCHSADIQLICGPCSNAFYCSRKCRRLDWKVHKTFCNLHADKKQEEIRRNYCLGLIERQENFTFKYLFETKFETKRPVFLLIQFLSAAFVPDYGYERLQKMGVINGKKCYEELHHELTRKGEHPKIVVLYAFEQVERVYVVSTSNLESLLPSVTSVPQEIVDQVLDIVDSDFQDGRERLIVQALTTHYLKTGKLPSQAGGFYDDHPQDSNVKGREKTSNNLAPLRKKKVTPDRRCRAGT